MSRIQQLPPIVIRQIAAGEVADRPATIIKELLENALDAEATQLKIEVELGRQTKIIVSDNGHGMSAEDLVIAPLRHTTSKITRFEDLQTLESFGFRGEALSAMAYASRMTLMSRLAHDPVGYAITAEQDQISQPRPVGMAVGTVIIIENLFERIPARQKFLKKPATELKLITDVISAAAVSQPQVGFIFEYHHKRVFALPPNQDLITRSLELYRLGQLDDLLEVSFGTPPLQISGWIGKPHLASYARHKQVWLVNHRPVQQTELNQIVKNSYGSLLEPRAEPSFVLHLQIPPSTLDINAHPQKSVVTFSQPQEITQLISTAISQRLATADLSYRLPSQFHTAPASYPSAPSASRRPTVSHQLTHFQTTTANSWQPGSSLADEGIMQLGRTYLVLENEQGLNIVDQHAAHERILFENFLQQLGQQPIQVEPAVVIHPTLSAKQTWLSHKAQLQKIGFEAEDFGQEILKLTTVPAVLTHHAPAQIAELFLQILDELADSAHSVAWDELQRQVLSSLACHSAVRAGDYLTPTQRQELLLKLANTPNAATCPHGRPTTIKVSMDELARLFKRQK